MERRLGHRLFNHTSVRVRTRGGEFVDAEIRDLSLSGAFVLSKVPVQLSDTVQLLFPPSGANHSAAVAARIARAESTGIGIEWTDFAPRPVSALLFAHWTREAARQIERDGRSNRTPPPWPAAE